jgi:hypothetical protein
MHASFVGGGRAESGFCRSGGMWPLEASCLICPSLKSLALGWPLDLPGFTVLAGTLRGGAGDCREAELDSAVTVVSVGNCA